MSGQELCAYVHQRTKSEILSEFAPCNTIDFLQSQLYLTPAHAAHATRARLLMNKGRHRTPSTRGLGQIVHAPYVRWCSCVRSDNLLYADALSSRIGCNVLVV